MGLGYLDPVTAPVPIISESGHGLLKHVALNTGGIPPSKTLGDFKFLDSLGLHIGARILCGGVGQEWDSGNDVEDQSNLGVPFFLMFQIPKNYM